MQLYIQVPATSANIGSGFDAVGLALKRYNVFNVTFLEVENYNFKGVEERFCNENHLFIQTLNQIINQLGGKRPKGIDLEFVGDVPVANGLGSSSTCIVAATAAALMYVDGKIDTQKMLDIAVTIEGHPDNVAPAILGGIVAGIVTDGNFLYKKDNLSDAYRFITITPDFEFPTHVARAALPEQLTYKQAIYNLSRSALLLPAFKDENDMLIKEVTKDAIHQQYRIDMIEAYKGVLSYFERLPIISAFLSGAGATICLIVREASANTVYQHLLQHSQMKLWDVRILEADNEGVVVKKG